VHFFAPTDLKPLHKHVVFVLDVSGSMHGRKIEQLKEAMMEILDDLNDGDYFNIVEFSYSVTVMIRISGVLCALMQKKKLTRF
jgi:predicted metal-dependent peptidase